MSFEDQVPELNIGNICGGAVPERFDREVYELFANIMDLNTDPEQKRKLTVTFTFTPSKDRKFVGVECAFTRKSAAIESVSGSVFLRGDQRTVRAYTEDPRQAVMFAQEPNASDSKQ